MNKKRILIIDDHEMIIAGLKNLIKNYPKFDIIDGCVDTSNITETIKEVKPDIIIIDISMPHLDGMKLIPFIKRRYPKTKVLVYTMHKENWIIQKLVKRKIDSYINKTQSSEEIIRAIYELSDDKTYFPDEITKLMLKDEHELEEEKTAQPNLTRREKQILDLILNEENSKSIAEILNLSVNTVETHRKNLIAKFQVKNTAGLVKQAFVKGFV
jgi:DNA-binding NarL/FixJ family response regulator